MAIAQIEDKLFASPELCLDEVRLTFDNAVLLLRPVPDTDEIEVKIQAAAANARPAMPHWCRDLAGKVLQTAWLCDNAQGYRDQVVLAFDSLSPTLAFVCEGSVLKVFRHCPVPATR